MALSNSTRNPKNLTEIIFEYAPIGIATITRQGIFNSFNSKFLEIHGGKLKSEFIGLDALKFPFYKETGLDNFILKALDGQMFDTEVSFTSSIGAKKSFRRYLGVPVLGPDGKTTETVLLMVEDITNQKRLEIDIQDYLRKLREEQSRFLASINSLSLGFIIIDIKNNLLIKNKAADYILGLPHLGGEIFLKGDIIQIEERLKDHFDLRASYERCLEKKQVIDVKEVKFDSKFLRIFLAPVILTRDSQEIIGAVILIEDITEAKILERSKEDFFAMASHELRTPLTAIRGNVSMIQDFFAAKIEYKEVLEMLDDIHWASVRLINIVDDFLSASSLEQKKISFRIESFNLIDLIKEILRDFKKTAADKNLYLKFEAAGGSFPKVKADRERTRQIIINLVGNAIRFTKKGGASINVKKINNFLKVYITDTGIGISPESQQLLFRKFRVAAEKTLTRDVASGTGLGLYISKLLVEGMAGQIALEKSALEQGSTFSFTLPVVDATDNKTL